MHINIIQLNRTLYYLIRRILLFYQVLDNSLRRGLQYQTYYILTHSQRYYNPDSMTTLGQRWAYNVGYVGSMLAQCWPSPLVQC